jgi:ribosomal protein S18 acetylase RimI-like enzyme
MTATLRPLRGEEFESWRLRSQAEYARSMIDHGGLPEDAAHVKAATDFAALLPDGAATQGHDIFVIEDGEPLGSLWVCERDNDTGRSLFVYELFVVAEARGRDVGRTAMTLAEDEARRRGLDTVTLNVFGGNEPARGLYRALGYAETAVFMTKDL